LGEATLLTFLNMDFPFFFHLLCDEKGENLEFFFGVIINIYVIKIIGTKKERIKKYIFDIFRYLLIFIL